MANPIQSKKASNVNTHDDEGDTVRINLTIPKEQYYRIVEVRKRKHMLSDQDLIRLYITMGLDQS